MPSWYVKSCKTQYELILLWVKYANHIQTSDRLFSTKKLNTLPALELKDKQRLPLTTKNTIIPSKYQYIYAYAVHDDKFNVYRPLLFYKKAAKSARYERKTTPIWMNETKPVEQNATHQQNMFPHLFNHFPYSWSLIDASNNSHVIFIFHNTVTIFSLINIGVVGFQLFHKYHIIY